MEQERNIRLLQSAMQERCPNCTRPFSVHVGNEGVACLSKLVDRLERTMAEMAGIR